MRKGCRSSFPSLSSPKNGSIPIKDCSYLLLEVTYLKAFLNNILNATLKKIRPHCVKRQARDDAQRQQVKLLFFVGFVISVKQKHPSLPYNLPLWSCKPVVDGSPIRCNRQGWVSSSPFSYPFLVNLYFNLQGVLALCEFRYCEFHYCEFHYCDFSKLLLKFG